MFNSFKRIIRKNKIIYSLLFNSRNLLIQSYYTFFRLLFFMFRLLFKISDRKIICSSYNNSKISCNPKYITKYILENYPEGDYDIVWILQDINNVDKSSVRGARFVKFLSIRYIYEMSTAKIILSNQRTDFVVGKRPGQRYIQLWHSSARLKKIEGDAEKYLSEYYIKNAKKDSKKTDIMVSGSKHSTEIFKRAFWYSGDILEIGTPRNDILFNNDIQLKNNTRTKIGVAATDKIALFAPTFRSNYSYDYNLFDTNRVKQILEEKFGGNWVILLRYHPNMLKEKIYKQNYNGAINVSLYEDIQELFLISDCIITDYSSVMFDFCLTLDPVFLFVPDLKQYYEKERELYFKLDQLPFSINLSMDELEKSIMNFDAKSYKNGVEEFLIELGSFETGNASERFMKYIEHVN